MMLVAMAACTSAYGTALSPDDAGPDATDGGGDATEPGDSASFSDSAEAAVIPPDTGVTNLLENGDFELGCAAWSVTPNASLTPFSTGAHGGTTACRLCLPEDGGTAVLAQEVVLDADLDAQHLGATGFVRSDDSETLELVFILRVFGGDGGILTVAQNPYGAADDWAEVAGTIGVPAGASKVTVSFGVAGAARCLDVDDVSLSAQP